MFRFAQQSQVIKSRISNQFVSASTRNSFNHSIRFNSAVSLERQDSSTGSNANIISGSSKASVAADRVRHMRNQLNASNPTSSNLKEKYNKKNSNINSSQINIDSPWYNQVCAFDDCVSSTLNMSQTPRRKNMGQSTSHPDANANPLFWDSIAKSMKLYHDLVENSVPELNPTRTSKLVHLLHNGLRANRNQLTRMNKKPDYDSQSFHKEMTNYLCQSLREISQDVLGGKVSLNEYGAMHLITAFKELLLFEEAVNIWKAAISAESTTYTSTIFLNPRVVGVILPMLYDNGVPFEEIKALYEKSASMIDFFHPNLSVGMIRASLAAGENEMALILFQRLCEEATENRYGYLIETHLSFIGECRDLNVAQSFFDKALNNEMPYKIDLQVSYVKSFLRNIWSETGDFQKVYNIWYKSSAHYGRNVNHGISSSLNDTFFDIFFEKYADNKMEGFQVLQNIIQTYNSIKPIDEPFFNIILTKCTVWRDRAIINYIDSAYDLYHIPKTIVAYRILLKIMGSIDDVTNEEILSRWTTLILKSDDIGQRFIANADWAALRDATITWTQHQLDKNTRSRASTPVSLASSSTDLFGMNHELDLSHPALQAANASGAFDEIAHDEQNTGEHAGSANENSDLERRVELYLKIVKRYSIYCRDSRQLSRLTSGTAIKYSVLEKHLKSFGNLDASDINIPELHNLINNSA
ncbi:hypothetical protein Kpol_534p30 [Vanderwaltozyma polyspora DSM 70294]|uniref:Protein RMD9, mitochondrial n=1 Tax=Vanderwaltozyma polyspora (strain ATCC 22028 / DSM 70294 / BCRC 21397 / CBS 2163 / NBRC 10782 / NRRL Y-8283 / UCD 57-17) TaxID=436907 RepID=A7TJK7_VANPO|nr:uncharacterized protein Kpol_534p30 [Vanderwaltozyma polyspora DSM 70294]EDO17550.1 hypothetical protein Kpol_534p30 [Vanderwaltozyma polyspora DSM 70294]